MLMSFFFVFQADTNKDRIDNANARAKKLIDS